MELSGKLSNKLSCLQEAETKQTSGRDRVCTNFLKDMEISRVAWKTILSPVELPTSCTVSSRIPALMACHPCLSGLLAISCLCVISAPVNDLSPILLWVIPTQFIGSSSWLWFAIGSLSVVNRHLWVFLHEPCHRRVISVFSVIGVSVQNFISSKIAFQKWREKRYFPDKRNPVEWVLKFKQKGVIEKERQRLFNYYEQEKNI